MQLQVCFTCVPAKLHNIHVKIEILHFLLHIFFYFMLEIV